MQKDVENSMLAKKSKVLDLKCVISSITSKYIKV